MLVLEGGKRKTKRKRKGGERKIDGGRKRESVCVLIGRVREGVYRYPIECFNFPHYK